MIPVTQSISQIPSTNDIQKYEVVEIPTKTYRQTEENISGIIDGRPALIQAINNILKTERGDYPIYALNFGVEFRQYIGASLGFIEATIQNTLRDALLQDSRILDILVTNVEQLDFNSVKIDFNVFDNIGYFEMESVFNV